MLITQFTRLFKSRAYRLFCYMIKLDGYERKLRLLGEQCKCVICEKETLQKDFKMTNKRQLAEKSQIEELKASLVRASANIARLEYICATQEHEIQVLSEKMCDFKGMKDVVKDIRGGIDELRINVNDLHMKQQPNMQAHGQDVSFENRLNCLETLAKDIEDQDRYFRTLSEDTAELKRQVNNLNDMCEYISQADGHEECPDDSIRVCTISSNSLQHITSEATYVSNEGHFLLTNVATCSNKDSSETELEYTKNNFQANEPSFANKLLDVKQLPSFYVEDDIIQVSSETTTHTCAYKCISGVPEQLFEKTSCNDSQVEGSDIKSIESDEIEVKSEQIEGIYPSIKHCEELLKRDHSQPDFLEGEDVKVCTSETSTAETLKCTSSMDPFNSCDELECKDIDSNDSGWIFSCLYFCDICF